MKIIESLERRYATKMFDSDKKISDENLEKIVESFRLSASSFGLQPWKLLYIENNEIRKKMLHLCYNQTQITDSSGVFILTRRKKICEKLIDEHIENIIKKTEIEESLLEGYKVLMRSFFEKMDDERRQNRATNQVMIALGKMLTVCACLKIDSCPIEGFNKTELDKLLNLDEKNLASVVLLPVGYRNKKDKYITKPKIRFEKKKIFEKID